MFRIINRPLILRSIPKSTIQISTFHATPISCARKQKDKKAGNKVSIDSEDHIVEIPTINFNDVTSKFESIISKFTKISNEIKMGKSNPKIFDNLSINDEIFTNLASTSIKGRNYIITLFDPSVSKHVISRIIEEFNMSGVLDPNNKFQIKIPLPPITKESKTADVKHLKEVFEKFKHNKTNSLNAIRGDIRNKFQGALKHHHVSDVEKRQLDELDRLLSTYTDKLTETFKAAEKQILK
ncbi:unnamed protein product [Candida verbasci]|uniref:Ribosome-recycling factor, mitochondrial n=1 Tax=Candida verbasci TaxID=1227364 RepID=A0A9W4TSS1_9ASCO|nr:unnamed protein product [Candida verbasci]